MSHVYQVTQLGEVKFQFSTRYLAFWMCKSLGWHECDIRKCKVCGPVVLHDALVLG